MDVATHQVRLFHTIRHRNPTPEISGDEHTRMRLFKLFDLRDDLPVADLVLRNGFFPGFDRDQVRASSDTH